MNNTTEVKVLNLKDIIPDENQPRKYFSAEKMKTLRKSIQEHGIMSPLIVEKIGDKYLIIDGERRFRAAAELKLDQVPTIVEKPQTAVERLVRQFHVQEQHEAWTPVEKAQALLKLSDEMGMTLSQICTILGVSGADRDRYTAFANLADKSTYIKSEIPLDYARSIYSLGNVASHISEHELDKKLTLSDKKKIEGQTIKLIKEGHVTRRSDVTKIKDSFTKNPKLIEEFIEKGGTPSELFTKSKARGAYHLRNAVHNAAYIYTHGQDFLRTRDVKITERQAGVFKRAIKTLEGLVALTDY